MTTNTAIDNKNGLSLAKRLQKLTKSEIVARDTFGRTILHIVILCNRADVLKNLLKNPEIKHVLLLTDYESGWNCLHYAIFYKRLKCFRVIMEHLEASSPVNTTFSRNTVLIELLKCKDRNRAIPLQLLDNDFKDMLWVPQYIDLQNEFHLAYRYEKHAKNESKVTAAGNTLRNVQHNWWNSDRGGSDIFTFGCNKNNHLGFGDLKDKSVPCKVIITESGPSSSHLSYARYSRTRFLQICISKNHSIALDTKGGVFSCGVGSRGRLGQGNNDMNNIFKFRRIKAFDTTCAECCLSKFAKILTVAVSNDHSLALSSDNRIYSWGLNNLSQLGYNAAKSQNSLSSKAYESCNGVPEEVISGDLRKNRNPILGIEVTGISSLAFTKNEIFFWGLNIGQIGMVPDSDSEWFEYTLRGKSYKGYIQSTPKRIEFKDNIKLVSSCDLSTCIVTENNDILVFFEFHRFKLPKIPSTINSDDHFRLFKPTKLAEGASIKKICLRSPDFIALLLGSGDALSFGITTVNLTNDTKPFKKLNYNLLWRSYDADMKIVDMDVSYDGSVILCTRNGSTFRKNMSKVMEPKNSHSENKISLSIVKSKFKRLDGVNRVMRVSCDDDFSSFGLIRDEIDIMPFKIKKNSFLEDISSICPFFEADSRRKQNEVLFGEVTGTYVTHFLYTEEEENEDLCDVVSNEFRKGSFNRFVSSESPSIANNDILKRDFDARYDSRNSSRPKVQEIFMNEDSNSPFHDKLISYLLSQNLSSFTNLSFCPGNYYDSQFTFQEHPEVSFKFHRSVFRAKSKVFDKIFKMSSDERFIKGKSFECSWDINKSELNVFSSADFNAIFLFICFLYLSFDTEMFFLKLEKTISSDDLKSIRNNFYDILRIFEVQNYSFENDLKIQLIALREMMYFQEDHDVIINLDDGTLSCHSFMLSTRSAYFETLLSDRWNPGNESLVIEYPELTCAHLKVVLRHLYGYDDLSIFNISELNELDSDDFICIALELIDFSEGLLLYELKNICELAIKDFISLDNIFSLLVYSDALNAKNLFLACCWFVYMNLDLIIIDQIFREMPFNVLEKLERVVLFLQNRRLYDVDPLNSTAKNNYFSWWSIESNALISDFAYKIEDFNERFNSDRKGFSSIAPLLDKKLEQKHSFDYGRKESKSRSSSSSDVKNLVAEMRKMKSELSTSCEESIDDTSEDNSDSFISTSRTKKRSPKAQDMRKSFSSSSGTNGGSKSSTGSRSAKKDEQERLDIGSTALNLNSSKRTEDQSTRIKAESSNLMLKYTWANKDQQVSDFTGQPILGSSQQNTMQKKEKLKMPSSARLSQKERRKLSFGLSDLSDKQNKSRPQSAAANPWDKVSPNPIITANVAKLPALGKSVSNLSGIRKSPMNSPESVTILEDSSCNQSKKKSLQEIQEEQKFDKWWKEETLRVQKEMKMVTASSQSKKKAHNTKHTSKYSPALADNKIP